METRTTLARSKSRFNHSGWMTLSKSFNFLVPPLPYLWNGVLYRFYENEINVIRVKSWEYCLASRKHYLSIFYYNYLFLKIYLFLFLLFFKLFIYFWLRGCVWPFSSCGERGLLFVAVRRLLTAVASLVAEALGARASVVVACGLQ